MSRRQRELYACDDCGAPVYRRRRYGRPVWCYECAAARAVSSALEMSNKAGPAWDAWCASNADGAPVRTQTPKE